MASLASTAVHGLRAPEKVYQRWQGPYMICAAWLGLFLAAITPPHGNGITVCWVKQWTGLDCLGCGLTRSLSCGMRGMFAESFSYHPFGLFILALFLFTAVTSVMPLARRQVALWMEKRSVFFNGFYFVFVITFVLFGLVRAMMEFAQLHNPL